MRMIFLYTFLYLMVTMLRLREKRHSEFRFEAMTPIRFRIAILIGRNFEAHFASKHFLACSRCLECQTHADVDMLMENKEERRSKVLHTGDLLYRTIYIGIVVKVYQIKCCKEEIIHTCWCLLH